MIESTPSNKDASVAPEPQPPVFSDSETSKQYQAAWKKKHGQSYPYEVTAVYKNSV